jgi:[protein-PII] uridylyltransferase
LCRLAKAIFDTKATIRSAHIATFGERAVDVFYLTDANGGKINHPVRVDGLKESLLRAAGEGEPKRKAA